MTYPPPGDQPPAEQPQGQQNPYQQQPYAQQPQYQQQPYGQPQYQQQPYGQPQYQPYPAPAGGRPTRLRGRTLLRLAAIFGIIGLALAIAGIAILATGSFGKVNGFSRVPIALNGLSRGTAEFSSAGNYLAYYEASNVSATMNKIPLPQIALKSPSGQVQTLDTLYGGEPRSNLHIRTVLTYDFNGHKGVAIYQFRVPQAGRYQVLVEPSGHEVPGADIAFGKSIGKSTALGAGLTVPGFLLIIVAVILLIIGLVRRHGHRKELEHMSAGGYGSPPGYGYPPPQPGGWQPPQ